MVQTTSRCLLGVLATLLLAGPKQSAGQDDLLRTVVHGYRANHDAFPHMIAESVVTQAKAQSVEKALAGEFLPVASVVAHGLYILSGDTERTELIYPPQLQEQHRVRVDEHRFSTAYVSVRELVSGSYHATHFPDNRQASIESDSAESRSIGYSLVRPFDMGMNGRGSAMRPDHLIEQSLSGTESAPRSLGEEVIDGHTTWVILCELHGMTVRLWVDPARGFLPVRQEVSTGGKLAYACRLAEIDECSNGRWLPRRGITVFTNAQDAPVACRETRLTEFEVDTPPAPEDLRLDLPPETSVSDTLAMVAWRPNQDGRPGFIDLNNLRVRAEAGSKQSPRIAALADVHYAPAKTAEVRTRWSWFGLVVALLIMMTLGVGVWIWTRRKSRWFRA